MPLSQDDMQDWPLPRGIMEQYNRRVIEYDPLAGRKDRLERLLPLYTLNPWPQEFSEQARILNKHMHRIIENLEKHGFFFGQSSFGACFDGSLERSNKCTRCGLCLYGCMYDDLNPSAWTVDELCKNKSFRFLSDCVVNFIEKCLNSLTIYAKKENGNLAANFKADKVFFAAGSIARTRIVLQSRKCTCQQLWQF